MITFTEAQARIKVVKAMAHPVRMMVIEYLNGRNRAFSEISRLFKLDKSTISKHLLVLKTAGIISSQKQGRDMIYKLNTPCVTKFFNCATIALKKNTVGQMDCLRK